LRFCFDPSFDRQGNLYIVDVPFGRIFRISPEGIFDLVTEYDGEPDGLKIHREGRIFVADHKQGILLLDPNRGSVSSVVDEVRSRICCDYGKGASRPPGIEFAERSELEGLGVSSLGGRRADW
jgi:sugar lactone lactonase YvrE